jgi:hypothetical protein
LIDRHCEEQRDEAIRSEFQQALDCFAEPVIGPRDLARTRWLAMTREKTGLELERQEKTSWILSLIAVAA